MSKLTSEQMNFINAAVETQALMFGEFTLKSGRISPYFFNASRLLSSVNLTKIIDAFVAVVKDKILDFDQLFGPAYKGTIFGSMIGLQLKTLHPDLQLSFDRKEVKNHGEGGHIIGADPKGKVIIIDDVLSAGTAAKASIKLLQHHNAEPKMLLVGLDRQEKGSGELSAKEELQAAYNIEVRSVICLDDLIEFTSTNVEFKPWENQLTDYRHMWGT
ncbi:MAG: orotate phosphoribosyltransferase [Gammaproteobacteria bacterium]